MRSRLAQLLPLVAVVVSAPPTMPAAADTPSRFLRSQRLDVTLREDLHGFASIVDRTTGRDYAAQAQPSGLYRLVLGGGRQRTIELSSLASSQQDIRPIDGGVEMHFEHEGEVPLQVTCRAWSNPKEPLVRFRISVENMSKFPLTLVEFPRAVLTLPLGADSRDDAIVYPGLEGVLLCDPQRNFRHGGSQRDTYPSSLSAQFLYYFDPQGGFYLASTDGTCRTKELAVTRRGETLELSAGHCFPRVVTGKVEVPYDVVWGAAGGTWQSAAELYRAWAGTQPWCARTLAQRDVPNWLTQANVFLNYTANVENAFYPAPVAAQTFARYREYFGVPLVCAAFGWERHGSWIGPEFFPPFGGEETYIQVARELGRLDSHLQLYTSGFRWGVKKPVSERTGGPRRYTDYDSTERWKQQGRTATVVTRQGELEFSQPPWADNYTLCVGSKQSQEILADCFRKIFRWGVAGVDLDQNLGAAVPACYSTEHGHPPGTGPWQFQAMSGFLASVRQEAKARSADAFLGVEEPCEAYIPWLDAYHGRAFTDTVWPARGPGAVSIPLYIYLYHEYQIGYAGWIDSGFSPFGDERIGLGRSFIFGMQPGIRISAGTLDAGGRTRELLSQLRGAAQLLERTRDYLLLGRMIDEPRVLDSPVMVPRPSSYKGGQRPPLPVSWHVVQATAWRSAAGHVCYAVANLGDQPQSIRLELQLHGMPDRPLNLRRMSADGDREMLSHVRLPRELPLQLRPWEILCVEQTPS